MSVKKSKNSPKKHHQPLYKRLLKWLGCVILVFALLIGIVYIAFQVSPWPSALLIRDMFTKDAAEKSQALEKYVPSDIASSLNHQYKQGDKDAQLDVYTKDSTTGQLPTIVWVHGGGWISGDKSDIANYLKILAGKGYTTVSVGYTIAPEKQYPTPVIQTNAALKYINQHAKELHIDPKQIILAGDSAGSQIAAQVATLTTNTAYAKDVGITPSLQKEQITGMLLNCGAYDIGIISDNGNSTGAKLLKTFLWSYSGKKDFMHDQTLMKASVIDYVTADFPPSFITAGNGDPLLPQSQAFAKKLDSLQVPTSQLFYPRDYNPSLPHEYQFNLDTAAGKTALQHMTQFLAKHTSQ